MPKVIKWGINVIQKSSHTADDIAMRSLMMVVVIWVQGLGDEEARLGVVLVLAIVVLDLVGRSPVHLETETNFISIRQPR